MLEAKSPKGMNWFTVNYTFFQMAVDMHVWGYILFAIEPFKRFPKLHKQQICFDNVSLGNNW